MRVVASLGVPDTDPVAAARALAAVAAEHELVITHAPAAEVGPAVAIARELASLLRPVAVATLLTEAVVDGAGIPLRIVERPAVDALLDAGIVAVCEAERAGADPALTSAVLARGVHADVLLLLSPDLDDPSLEAAARRFLPGGGRVAIGRLHDAPELVAGRGGRQLGSRR